MSAVEVFTPPSDCMSCRYVKRWLTRRGIEFVVKPMTDEVRDEFFERGFREFPVTVYNGHAFSGMREHDLERLAHDYHYFE